MKITGKRNKFVRDLLEEISRILLRKHALYYRISARVERDWLDKTLSPKNLITVIDLTAEDIVVSYKVGGIVLATCTVEIASMNTVSCVLKIGNPRRYSSRGGTFRLKVDGEWNNVHEYTLQKDLEADLGFQKSLFSKVLSVIEPNIASGKRSSEIDKQNKRELNDIELQFPDFNVSKSYSGWKLEHNESKILIEMSKELDIIKIEIPRDSFVTYPDGEFMNRLIAIFKENGDNEDEPDEEEWDEGDDCDEDNDVNDWARQ